MTARERAVRLLGRAFREAIITGIETVIDRPLVLPDEDNQRMERTATMVLNDLGAVFIEPHLVRDLDAARARTDVERLADDREEKAERAILDAVIAQVKR